MSRVGKMPIALPKGVAEVDVRGFVDSQRTERPLKTRMTRRMDKSLRSLSGAAEARALLTGPLFGEPLGSDQLAERARSVAA